MISLLLEWNFGCLFFCPGKIFLHTSTLVYEFENLTKKKSDSQNENENKNSQPNMLQNSYSDIEMKICSADPNTNQDSMTKMMTVIFVIDVLQQKPGTCHHHFELGGRLPARCWVVAHMCVKSHFRTCDVRGEVRAEAYPWKCVRSACVQTYFKVRCAIARFSHFFRWKFPQHLILNHIWFISSSLNINEKNLEVYKKGEQLSSLK